MGGSSATRVFVPALQPPRITATVTAEIGITRMPITSKFGLADLCRVISPSSASAHKDRFQIVLQDRQRLQKLDA
jgi:hypothetical protein